MFYDNLKIYNDKWGLKKFSLDCPGAFSEMWQVAHDAWHMTSDTFLNIFFYVQNHTFD